MDYFGGLNNYTNINNINLGNNTGDHTINIEYHEVEDKEENDTYTREELEEIKKEILPGESKLNTFFYLYDLKRSEDIPTTNPLTDLSFSEDQTVTLDIGSTDPVDSGRKLYNRRHINISPNLITTLIGCNGAGKSSLIICMESILKSNDFPLIKFDNLHDGGQNSISEFAFLQDFSKMASLMTSSEGESIVQNIFPRLEAAAGVVRGLYKRNHSGKLFRETDHIFIILDALDSGFSIDNICNIKLRLYELIQLAKEHNKYLYIVIAANSFEMVVDTNGWDVQGSKYMYFSENDYPKYKKFIMKTRNRIIKQWDKLEEKSKKE